MNVQMNVHVSARMRGHSVPTGFGKTVSTRPGVVAILTPGVRGSSNGRTATD
jgi:hypothetical protein